MSRRRKKNTIIKDKNREEQRNAHGRVRAKKRDILNGVDIDNADDVVIPYENELTNHYNITDWVTVIENPEQQKKLK